MTRPKPFVAQDLAVIVPTRNRPSSVARLLDSLLRQKKVVGRVIIIASGTCIKATLQAYWHRLHMTYRYTAQAGQIHQRNLGLQCLNHSTRLVATIDDDIEFMENALEAMLYFWNDNSESTAGVGFNVINEKGHHSNALKTWCGISTPHPGTVSKAGWPTTICNVTAPIRTEWLAGGTTVWRQSVITAHPHKAIASKWAICEDVIFSYPLGRKYPLFICAAAQVKHHDAAQTNKRFGFQFSRGRRLVLWQYYFVTQNTTTLSSSRFYFSWLVYVGLLPWTALIQPKQLLAKLGYFLGLLTGLGLCLRVLCLQRNIEARLD